MNKNSKLNEFIKNPHKALITLSLPMMAGMSVQAIYMLVDTAFIGKWVGGEALTSLGIIFPPMFIIMGITFGLGSGATTVIAQSIGEKNKAKADNASEHILMLGVFLSIFFIGLALLLGDYIINSQSTNSTVIAHSENYYYTMLYGTPFMILSILMTHHL